MSYPFTKNYFLTSFILLFYLINYINNAKTKTDNITINKIIKIVLIATFDTLSLASSELIYYYRFSIL